MKRIKMPSIRPYSKILKWILIPLACLVVIIFLAGIFLSHYATQKVEDGLKSSGITFGSLDVNLFSRAISVSELKISLYDSLKDEQRADGHFKNIALNQVSLYQLLKNKTLRIGEV